MPKFFVRTTNATFEACDEGAEYERAEAALAVAVNSALTMLADEVNSGKTSAAVEVSVEGKDRTEILRSVVVASVSPLLPKSQGG